MRNIKILFITFILISSQNTFGQNYTPEIFEKGVISTGEYETHPAFTPTGDTLYFLKCNTDASFCIICVSYKVNGKWTSPEIAEFSGKYLDADPFVTKDGNTIYFVSNRPLDESQQTKDNWDIWETVKTDTGWRKPIHLDYPINSDGSNFYPTIADNGNLYFGSTRKGGFGGADIYVSKYENGKYTTPINLGDSINTEHNEYEPFIAPDESYMVFMATIPNGLSHADFYISHNLNGHWSKAKKLPEPISSSATDWGGKVTRDGKYFFFGSNRSKKIKELPKRENIVEFSKRLNFPGNGLGDIYMIDAYKVLGY